MDNKLQEAVALYKKGDKAQASKLLAEIVRQEPNNSVAWYGLALCLDELDKRIYCLKRVLSLDPTHEKARQLLEKLQGNEKIPSVQKAISNSPASAIAKKGTSFNWLGLSIVGVVGVICICVVGGVIFTNNMIMFQPTPTPIPTYTPRPSPTPSIFTGEPIDYYPILPDRFEIDYAIKQIDTTLSDGTRTSSIGFRNREALFYGDLISVVYFINIYTSESKAVSEYQKYINRLEADDGSIDSEIGIDGSDASAMYINVQQEDNILEGQYISRIKNVVVVNIGLTTYDPQTVTEAFLKDFMAELAEIQILSINKLSK